MSSQTNPMAFLGVGWAFPLAVDPTTNDVAIAAYELDVRESILIILGTNPGERVMRPDFGAGLQDFVFSLIDTTVIHAIQQQVNNALVLFEPRIDVNDVQATASPDTPGLLLIRIDYTVRSTNSLQNMVYPFYLSEGATG